MLKVLLFIALIPGQFISIPETGPLWQKAVVHGVVFALVNYLVYIYIRPMLEGFENPDTRVDQPCPPNSIKCPSGDCKLKTDIYGMC